MTFVENDRTTFSRVLWLTATLIVYCRHNCGRCCKWLMESNMTTDSGRLYCGNVCLNAMSTTSTSILFRGGGGCTRPIFGYGWAADGLKPWQKIPKIHTLFRTTPSILLLEQTRTNHAHCLGQTCAKLYTLFTTDLCEIIYPV